MKWIFPLVAFFMVADLSAQSKNAKAQNYFNQAVKESDLGNPRKAISLLNKAIKKDRNFSSAYSLLADMYEKEGDTARAVYNHRKSIKTDPLYQYNYYVFAKYLFSLERYDEALKVISDFEAVPSMPGFDEKKDGVRERTREAVTRLKESCAIAKADTENISTLNIRNMGPSINTKLWEYWPGMTIDGRYFIFTKLVDGQEDFYISRGADTGWQKAGPLPGKINTPMNEGTTSVSADGRLIFYTVCSQEGFGSCDIFWSYYDPRSNLWSRRTNLGKAVNSAEWDAQPTISADAHMVIFASARPGGYGGKDLWLSTYNGSVWSAPTNLGPTVNTIEDEEAPSLHYDGKTLYFSSEGHPGYGMLDLFITRLNADGTWSKPVNLGKGINTNEDELGLYVDRKGELAYFVSTRKGGYGGADIYTFTLGKDKQPSPVSFVEGNIFDFESRKELGAKIEIVNLKNNKILFLDSSDYFFTTLEPGGNYALNAYSKGYLFYSANFQPELADLDSPYIVNAYLKKLKNNETTVLENIFFDVDKYDLKPESHIELDALLHLLRNNPGISVEISGHTDNTGGDEHNLVLSENRAKSVSNYLVSRGIAAKRISTKGYGSKAGIADNGTEEGRALNRRIEMKIVGME